MAGLRSLASALLGLVCARAELVAVELRQERQRAVRNLMLTAVAMLFLALGTLMTAFFVVICFWDTHRTVAAGGVTLLFLLVGGGALLRLRVLERDAPAPFAGTLGEFAKDLELLRGRHG